MPQNHWLKQRIRERSSKLRDRRSVNTNKSYTGIHGSNATANNAVFNLESKVNCICFGFALLRTVIGQQNSLHFFNQWGAKPKPIATCTRAFSRALRLLHVIASYSDWFITLFTSVVIGQSNNFSFGFTTLNRKPLWWVESNSCTVLISGALDSGSHASSC